MDMTVTAYQGTGKAIALECIHDNKYSNSDDGNSVIALLAVEC
jgi:hypothetical protein